MADREPSFDAKAALDASTELIEAARTELIQTFETYSTIGPKQIETVLERLQELNEPESLARTKAIASLTRELPRFNGYWLELTTNSGFLLLSLQSKLLDMAVEMMTIPFPSGNDVASGDPMEILHAYTGAIHEATRRNEILIASAVTAERDVAMAVQEAAGLLIARLNLLAAFISETDLVARGTDTAPRWITRSIGRDVAGQTAVTAAGDFLKEALKQIPVAGIAVSIADIALEVREKREALRRQRELWEEVVDAYRRPNAYEAMENLLIQLEQDNKDIEDVLRLTGKLQAAFMNATKPAT